MARFRETANAVYRDATSQVSTVVRSLALVAIAISWLLAGGFVRGHATPQGVLSEIRVDGELHWSLWFAVVCLLFDCAQYAFSALQWGLSGWAVDQVLLNDRTPGPLRWRPWLGWGLLRLYGIASHAYKIVGVAPQPSDKETWRGRRNALRQHAVAGSTSSERTRLQEAIDSWTPASLARPALVLFVLKVLALLASYVLLLIYFSRSGQV